MSSLELILGETANALVALVALLDATGKVALVLAGLAVALRRGTVR